MSASNVGRMIAASLACTATALVACEHGADRCLSTSGVERGLEQAPVHVLRVEVNPAQGEGGATGSKVVVLRVRNDSGRPVRSVAACFTFFDAEGERLYRSSAEPLAARSSPTYDGYGDQSPYSTAAPLPPHRVPWLCDELEGEIEPGETAVLTSEPLEDFDLAARGEVCVHGIRFAQGDPWER